MKTTITKTITVTVTVTDTTKWLDRAKEKLGLSDYALAPMLGLSRSQISNYRNGRDFLSDDAALKLANLLEMDSPAVIIASSHAERAKSDDARAFWSQLAGMFTKEKAPAPVGAGASNVGGNGRYCPPNSNRRRAPAPSKLADIMRSFLSAPSPRFA